MKDLAAREAYRAKQKANEAKQRRDEVTYNSSETEPAAFSASDYLNGSVQKINGGLKELSDEELSAVDKAEANGKKRTGIVDAINNEKKRRAASSSGWSGNAG